MPDHTLDLLDVLQKMANFHQANIFFTHNSNFDSELKQHTHVLLLECYEREVEVTCTNDYRLLNYSIGITWMPLAGTDNAPTERIPDYHRALLHALRHRALLHVPPALRKIGSSLTVQPQP